MPETAHDDVIIVPTHNRRAVTAGALGALAAAAVSRWADVLVADGGSTDGTPEMVARDFPGVQVLRGDGTWWWARAVRRGSEWALARGAQRVLWLNDDCQPPPGGLWALRERVRTGRCVAWIDVQTPGGWSYGGYRRTAWRVRRCTPAEEQAHLIDAFSGNCVCLPREWIERVGLPHDELFPQGTSDLDYGLRLKAAGATLAPLDGFVAIGADPHPATVERWLTTRCSMRDIWRTFSSPRSVFYFPAWWRFTLRHWGPVWGLVVFAAPYCRWAAIAAIRATAPALARWWAARRPVN
jgi:glycosyltransferase involved in cell wall biosynthesis